LRGIRLNLWKSLTTKLFGRAFIMEDQRTARLFGFALGMLFTACLVLNAFAF